MTEHAIVERLVYRLIKKHIAGTTMSSAIEKTKELNGKKLPVSLSFLSDSADDSTKARYATTTYLELTRRIARMGLKASIQVPMSQIGFGISESIAVKNLREILDTAKKYGVFVWLEIQDPEGKMPSFLREARGVGYAISVNNSRDYIGRNAHIRALKVLCTDKLGGNKEEPKNIASELRLAAKKVRNAVVQSAPEGAMRELLNGSDSKKSLIFEFQLGYSAKRISEMMKKGARTSVYVPFGKDWAQYAINRAPERYARFIATKILKEER